MEIKSRYKAGGTWKKRIFQKKGKASQTPGNKKGETCQLTSIGGLPRKAYMRSRSYKYSTYNQFCNFSDIVNKVRTA